MLPPEEAARADTYVLLGALLARPPTDDLLTLLRQLDTSERPGPGLNTCDMATAWSVLKLAAKHARAEALADEFYALFIGLGRGEMVPYGSWYLTGFLMEKPLAKLRLDLAELGFERAEAVKEPEDHAAALCEVMAMIINSAGEIPFETQQTFFAEHMGSWMGRFFSDLRSAQAANFYTAVGNFGGRFMELESRYFSMLV
jgi:TorA maturation chaperone TorD